MLLHGAYIAGSWQRVWKSITHKLPAVANYITDGLEIQGITENFVLVIAA